MSPRAGSYRRGVYTPPVVSPRDAEVAKTIAAEIMASLDLLYTDRDYDGHLARNQAAWREARGLGPAIDYEVARLVRGAS